MPLLFIGVIIVGFYFLIIRPQQKRQREAQATIERLQVGQRVMTTAGIFGVLTEVDDETVALQVAPAWRSPTRRRPGARVIEDDDADPEHDQIAEHDDIVGQRDQVTSEPDGEPSDHPASDKTG